MRKRNKILVWPVYLDSSKTRREGRRIPLKMGVNSPRLSELIEAAEKLGLEPEPNPDAAHPRTWWNRTGYILVKGGLKKSKVLRVLASKISEMRLQIGELHQGRVKERKKPLRSIP
ncbi:MAG: signal recognition particle subunit SRP19/SEC65 family protein [Candidatus Bathyarchaeia archaeon]